MKHCCIILVALFVLVSCGKESHPKEVYEAYIEEVQKIESLSEFPFSSYLSKRAQGYTAEKLERAGIRITNLSVNGGSVEIENVKTDSSSMASEKMKDVFLRMWKSEALMPAVYNEEWKLGDKNAEWTFVDNEFLDPDTQLKDSTLKTNVHFVNEGGWKIDKIVRTRTSKDGSTMKSTTY